MKCQVRDCKQRADYVLKTKAEKYLEVEIYLCSMHYSSCFDHTTEKQLKEILEYATLAPEISE